MKPDPRLYFFSTTDNEARMDRFVPPACEFFESTELRAVGRKTSIWDIRAKNGTRLGDIKYWPAWRRFVFCPEAHTLFDFKCLTAIAEFCSLATAHHRESLKVKT